MKTLVAGPWVGEFGWELFAWHAYVRALSRNFDKTIVICRKNSQYLYEDCAHKFLVCEPSTGLADSFFMHGFDQQKELKNILLRSNISISKDTSLFTPRRIGWPPNTHYSEEFKFGSHVVKPEYLIFKNEEISNKYDFIFHARNRKLRSEDNWSPKRWEELVTMLGGRIACIGTKAESLHIRGTEDLRGLPLNELCGIINLSKCVFGPSSGPMHLASLCNTPHVVWSIPGNKTRYENTWNPHKTPVLFLCDYKWHPKAEYVYEKYADWIKEI